MLLRLCQLVPVTLLAIVGVAGCANIGTDTPPTGTDGGGAPVDVGLFPGTDAGARDGAAAADADPTGLLDPEADCFDFRDDESDGFSDCADPGCFVDPVCCALGSDAAACCAPGASRQLELAACNVGDDARTCAVLDAAPVSAFGSAPFTLMEGAPGSCAEGARAMVPGPGELADSGLRLPGTLDLAASRTEISLTLGRSGREGLARAGVAIVADEAPGARVLPILGLVTSGGELRVVIGEAEVAHTSELGDCASRIPVRIVLEAGGAFQISRGGVVIHAGTIPTLTRAAVVVYGRHDDGEPAAWVGDVSVRSDVCARLAPARSVTPVVEGVSRDARIGRVSVARVDPAELGRAVIEVDGRILPATEVLGGIRVDDAVNPLVPADGARSGADWAAGASDPQLVARATGYLLLFTGHDQDGSSAFFASTLSAALGSPTPPEPTFTLTDASALVGRPVTGIAHPTYFEHDGDAHLLFVATTATGSELRLAALSATLEVGADLSPVASGRDAEYADASFDGALVRNGDGAGFDRDEIGAARVVELGDGVVRVIYAGRRGTRWAVGALVSRDLSHFDRIDDGAALLGPSGAGFDSLGVLSPEPVLGPVVDGVADLTLYYTGSTGTRTSLGAAVQSIHAGGL